MKRFDLLDQRSIEKDDAIVGMIEHERGLIGKEPDVHRVEHRTDHRNGVIQFHVPVTVPGK